jgi:hypothetical protein
MSDAILLGDKHAAFGHTGGERSAVVVVVSKCLLSVLVYDWEKGFLV